MFKLNKEYIHDLFNFVIIIKGIHGLLELLSGLVLVFTRSDFIVNLINMMFRHELIEDPTDLTANLLIHSSQHLTHGGLVFASIYLIIYGLINLGLFFGLWYKKLWVYPLAGFIIICFLLYQIIRVYFTHSLVLFIIILMDTVILLLLHFEYIKTLNSLK